LAIRSAQLQGQRQSPNGGLGRNTFNPSLVFFTIVRIGLLGFGCDWPMRQMQRRALYLAPRGAESLRGV